MTHIFKKTISITLAVVICSSTVRPTIAQPVPVLALPLVSNPAGLLFLGIVTVAGVSWYIYQDSHKHKVRSRVAPITNVHKIEPGRHQVGDRVKVTGKAVTRPEECERIAREYGSETDGGEWVADGADMIGNPGEPGWIGPNGEVIEPVVYYICWVKKVR